jgi:hypothetical protein
MAEDDDRFGPVDFVVVEFPEGRVDPAGFTQLLDLVDRGIIRVLDLEFIAAADGQIRTVPISELDTDLTAFEGASSGLLDREDLATVAEQMEPGAIAAVLIYEELSLLSVLQTWEDAGASLVAGGTVEVADIDAALAAAELTS